MLVIKGSKLYENYIDEVHKIPEDDYMHKRDCYLLLILNRHVVKVKLQKGDDLSLMVLFAAENVNAFSWIFG